ncbi:2Fe-2S iron-sulfur cluster-binding protein [Brevibacillus nitrificans]|uniref:2Fe-2S iron-sulfur cluster-binding protein n=1 Tax=Brevibacillus nitrificans TaxID=651560 RepID=UPI002857801B|nr:2Fe-2S iron-sulfur cluster-binding protein [Brevibacillus nitrificans]MDR7317882.1 ferredoxin [Brevibacillus nitrificans]
MEQPDLKQNVVTVVQGEDESTVYLSDGDNLLMGLVRANLPVEFFCTTGKCTTCRLRVVMTGDSAKPPSETEQYRLGIEAIAKGYRLACQVFVTGDMRVFLP